MDDDTTATRGNLAAIEAALDALASIRHEFTPGDDARWFVDLTCTLVYDNFRLHASLDTLQSATTPWRARFAIRGLTLTLLDVVQALGGLFNRSLDVHLAALTNNPAITEPIGAVAMRLAAFRRVNDKRLRVLAKALGVDHEAKARERLDFAGDLPGEEIVGLALEVMGMLSEMGRAATLLISAIRGERRREQN